MRDESGGQQRAHEWASGRARRDDVHAWRDKPSNAAKGEAAAAAASQTGGDGSMSSRGRDQRERQSGTRGDKETPCTIGFRRDRRGGFKPLGRPGRTRRTASRNGQQQTPQRGATRRCTPRRSSSRQGKDSTRRRLTFGVSIPPNKSSPCRGKEPRKLSERGRGAGVFIAGRRCGVACVRACVRACVSGREWEGELEGGRR